MGEKIRQATRKSSQRFYTIILHEMVWKRERERERREKQNFKVNFKSFRIPYKESQEDPEFSARESIQGFPMKRVYEKTTRFDSRRSFRRWGKKEDQEEHDSQFFTVFFVAVKNESTRAKKKSQVTWHMIKFSEESKAERNWRDWRGRQVKRDRRTWNTKKSLDLVLKTWLTFDSLPFYLHEMEK